MDDRTLQEFLPLTTLLSRRSRIPFGKVTGSPAALTSRRGISGGLAILLLLAACDGSGHSADPESFEDGSIPDLETTYIGVLSIVPNPLSLDPGQAVLLTAIAHYYDGTSVPVEAGWSTGPVGLLSLSADHGDRVTVTATSVGPELATVAASAPGLLMGTATVRINGWPQDVPEPGTIFAAGNIKGVKAVYRYPANGGAPVPVYRYEDDAVGIAMSPSNTYVYGVFGRPGTMNVARMNATTGAVAVLAQETTMGWFGCAVDSQDRLYSMNSQNVQLTRFDPASGALDALGVTARQVCLAIGPDDEVFTSPLIVGGAWIYRQNTEFGTAGDWAPIPSLDRPLGRNGFMIPGGLAINELGEAFFLDFLGPDVYKAADLNEDGDAMDEGEVELFGTLPFEQLDFGHGIVWGVGLAPGRGVFVNVEPNVGADSGIYRLVDGDGDGSALDEGEVVLRSATAVGSSQNPCFFAVPR